MTAVRQALTTTTSSAELMRRRARPKEGREAASSLIVDVMAFNLVIEESIAVSDDRRVVSRDTVGLQSW